MKPALAIADGDKHFKFTFFAALASSSVISFQELPVVKSSSTTF